VHDLAVFGDGLAAGRNDDTSRIAWQLSVWSPRRSEWFKLQATFFVSSISATSLLPKSTAEPGSAGAPMLANGEACCGSVLARRRCVGAARNLVPASAVAKNHKRQWGRSEADVPSRPLQQRKQEVMPGFAPSACAMGLWGLRPSWTNEREGCRYRSCTYRAPRKIATCANLCESDL